MKTQITLKKIISIMTAAALSLQPILPVTHAMPAAEILAMPYAAAGLEMQASLRQAVQGLSETVASVESVFTAPQGAQRIFHLQDAHSSLEAQKSIQKTLEHLIQHTGIRTLFLEGASEEILADRLRYFDSDSDNQRAAELMLRQGLIGGTEIFLLSQAVRQPELRIFGVEKAELYRKNLAEYRAVMRQQDHADDYIQGLITETTSLSSKVFNPKLHRFFKAWNTAGNLGDLSRQSALLEQASEGALGLNWNHPSPQINWPNLYRFIKLQQVQERLDQESALQDFTKLRERAAGHKALSPEAADSLTTIERLLQQKDWEHQDLRRSLEKLLDETGLQLEGHQALSDILAAEILRGEIQAPHLMDEMERLRDLILKALTETTQESAVLEIYSETLLLKRLFKLECDSRQIEQLLTDSRRLNPVKLADRLDQVSPDSLKAVLRGEEMMPLYDQALNFYRSARERDAVMHQKMRERMKEQGVRDAILITGGFHARGLQDMWKKEGISYVQLSPHISDLRQQTAHEEALLGQGNPLVRLATLNRMSAADAGFAFEMADDPRYGARLNQVIATVAVYGGLPLSARLGEINRSSAARLTPHGRIYTDSGIWIATPPALVPDMNGREGFAGIDPQGPAVIANHAEARSEVRALFGAAVLEALMKPRKRSSSPDRHSDLYGAAQIMIERIQPAQTAVPAPDAPVFLEGVETEVSSDTNTQVKNTFNADGKRIKSTRFVYRDDGSVQETTTRKYVPGTPQLIEQIINKFDAESRRIHAVNLYYDDKGILIHSLVRQIDASSQRQLQAYKTQFDAEGKVTGQSVTWYRYGSITRAQKRVYENGNVIRVIEQVPLPAESFKTSSNPGFYISADPSYITLYRSEDGVVGEVVRSYFRTNATNTSTIESTTPDVSVDGSVGVYAHRVHYYRGSADERYQEILVISPVDGSTVKTIRVDGERDILGVGFVKDSTRVVELITGGTPFYYDLETGEKIANENIVPEDASQLSNNASFYVHVTPTHITLYHSEDGVVGEVVRSYFRTNATNTSTIESTTPDVSVDGSVGVYAHRVHYYRGSADERYQEILVISPVDGSTVKTIRVDGERDILGVGFVKDSTRVVKLITGGTPFYYDLETGEKIANESIVPEDASQIPGNPGFYVAVDPSYITLYRSADGVIAEDVTSYLKTNANISSTTESTMPDVSTDGSAGAYVQRVHYYRGGADIRYQDIVVFNPADFAPVKTIRIEGQPDILEVRFSENSARIIELRTVQTILYYDLETEQPVQSPANLLRSEIRKPPVSSEDDYFSSLGASVESVLLVSQLAENTVSEEHRLNPEIFQMLVNRLSAAMAVQSPALDLEVHRAAMAESLEFMQSLAAQGRIQLASRGTAFLSTDGDHSTRRDLVLSVLPYFAALLTKDRTHQFNQSVMFTGENAEAIKQTVFGSESGLSAVEQGVVSRIIQFSKKEDSLAALIQKAETLRPDAGLAASVTAGQIGELQAFDTVLRTLENPQDLMAAKNPVERAEASFVRAMMLLELAEVLKLNAAVLKEQPGDVVRLVRTFFEKRLPDIAVLVQGDGTFELSLSSIAAQLSVWKAAQEARERSA